MLGLGWIIAGYMAGSVVGRWWVIGYGWSIASVVGIGMLRNLALWLELKVLELFALIFASFVEKLGLMVGILIGFVVHAMEFNSCFIF